MPYSSQYHLVSCCLPTDSLLIVGRYSVDSLLIVDRYSIDSLLIIDRYSVDSLPWLLVSTSIQISSLA